MAQRRYNIPIDRIEEYFPMDYRQNQDEPGNNTIINSTIEGAMQTQLIADDQTINRTGYSLEEIGETLENNLDTSHPRRFNGDQSPTNWNEVRIQSTTRSQNEEFRRRMNELNLSESDTSNFYDVSFHNILNQIAEKDESELLNLQRCLHRNEVTLTNEKTIINNDILITKLLPKELAKYKDVFEVPRGLPPSRGKWDYKLNITPQDLKQLPLAKPKLTSEEASIATKAMIKNYMDEGWIEPAVLSHAVNMFSVPKHDGSFRYVYNYVPIILN
ncbi:hypothetical protein U3516DRAFT_656981 [Neocallimastix sp. 'constans']